jgi:hypothetical protein
MHRNGHIILMPDEGVPVPRSAVEAALVAAGVPRWDGNDLPLLVVFHNQATKGDFFEAGFWAGAGVPIFFFGERSRTCRRGHLVNRFTGWTVVGKDGAASVEELLEAIRRRQVEGVAS